MSKSLAEMRQSKATSLPERSHRICLASALIAEVQALTEEQAHLEIPRGSDEDEPSGPPQRLGQGEPARAAEIRDRLAELWDEMDEHTGELRLRAIDNGEWRRWVDEHPAREGNDRDGRVAFGVCNGDDLLDSLGKWAQSWNGEPLAEGDWEFIRAKAAGGDLVAMAHSVVAMQEAEVDLPKLRRASLASL